MGKSNIGLDGQPLPDCPFCGGAAIGFESEVVATTWEEAAWTVGCSNCPAEIQVGESDGDEGKLELNQIREKAEILWRKRD